MRDRATILYVSKKNGVKLILNELTNYPKELGVDQEFHGDQDNVAEVISRYTIHDEPLGFDGEYPAKWLLSLREFGAASDYVLGDRALNLQRAHKDAEEMELLREASRMNDRVMAGCGVYSMTASPKRKPPASSPRCLWRKAPICPAG